VETKGSLPHSQEPATCPYSKSDQSSPYTQTHYLKIHFNIVLPPTPGFYKWTLSLRFPHKYHVYTSPLPHTFYIPRLSHSYSKDTGIFSQEVKRSEREAEILCRFMCKKSWWIIELHLNHEWCQIFWNCKKIAIVCYNRLLFEKWQWNAS